MKVSAEGLSELASHEGIVTSPYRDSVGTLTVYIGHTKAAGAPDPASLPMGKPQPVSKALDVFEHDIAGVEARVREAFTRPITQAQFDAAASFDFNTGSINRATWVKKFNAGDDVGARKSFMDWRKPSSIIPRRRAERDLFFDGKYSGNGFAMVYPADAKGAVQWSSGRRVKVLDILNEAPSSTPADPPSGAPVRPDPSPGKAVAVAGVAAVVAALAAWGEHVWHWIIG